MPPESELRDFPDDFLRAMANAPVVDEEDIDGVVDLGYRVGTRGRIRVDLSPRELEVLRYMSHGLSRTDTAGAMGIGLETVKTYLYQAKLLLRAKSTAHACCEAIRLGLFP